MNRWEFHSRNTRRLNNNGVNKRLSFNKILHESNDGQKIKYIKRIHDVRKPLIKDYLNRRRYLSRSYTELRTQKGPQDRVRSERE